MFTFAKISLDRIYFSLNLLVDLAQIRNFKEMYTMMIFDIITLQDKLEDKIVTFYQNLSEREQFMVIFSLPQFQNCLFLNAINRSINILNNN